MKKIVSTIGSWLLCLMLWGQASVNFQPLSFDKAYERKKSEQIVKPLGEKYEIKPLPEDGVQFQQLTLEEALKQAKEKNTMVFVNLYVEGWGDQMNSKVFTQKAVGDCLNPLICVMYEMKQPDGQNVIRNYQLRSFPRYLFLNPDGTVRHQLVGGDLPDKFVARLKEAFDDTKANGLKDVKYQSGCREKGFMIDYVKTCIDLGSMNVREVVVELFNLLSENEKVSLDYWSLVANSSLAPCGSPLCDYLVDNYVRYTEAIGKKRVDKYIKALYGSEVEYILSGNRMNKTLDNLVKMKADLKRLQLEGIESLFPKINIAKAFVAGEKNQIFKACMKEMKRLNPEDYPITLLQKMSSDWTNKQNNAWKKQVRKGMEKIDNPKVIQRFQKVLDAVL